jgi:hypothetical protein
MDDAASRDEVFDIHFAELEVVKHYEAVPLIQLGVGFSAADLAL